MCGKCMLAFSLCFVEVMCVGDSSCALAVWTELLPELLGSMLLLAYYKGSVPAQSFRHAATHTGCTTGSAFKMGAGNAVDYVPQLSDIDIHVVLSEVSLLLVLPFTVALTTLAKGKQ